MEPPWASMMVREIDRPTPMPCALVVTNGWNNCALDLRRNAAAGIGDADLPPCCPSAPLPRRTSSRTSHCFHRLDRVAHQVEQAPAAPAPGRRAPAAVGVASRSVTRHAASPAPTSASALASSTSLSNSSARRVVSPRSTKARRRRMISPLRERLVGGLVQPQRLAEMREVRCCRRAAAARAAT